MEDQEIRNELTEAYAALHLAQSQRDLAIEALNKIVESCDQHRIAEKGLLAIKELGQK